MDENGKPAESDSKPLKLTGLVTGMGGRAFVGMRATRSLAYVWRDSGAMCAYEPRVWDAK